MVHESGHRRGNRFVALNCDAIASTLLDNELFGSERGAFTGTVIQTIGRFQAADRGTWPTRLTRHFPVSPFCRPNNQKHVFLSKCHLPVTP